jgi:hypothetical protein
MDSRAKRFRRLTGRKRISKKFFMTFREPALLCRQKVESGQLKRILFAANTRD